MTEVKHGSGNISELARIHPNVVLGENVTIEEYCIIGYPPNGVESGELQTVIGDNCHIRSHSVIYAGTTFGANCKISHSVFIREHTTLGNNVSIGINCVIEHHCALADGVRLQGQAGLAEHTVVEEDAWIGPRTLTANVFHPTCDQAKTCLAGPTIRKGAIIGGNAFIAPDTEIGERAFVSAGSVVSKAVEPESIVFGVPARKIGTTERMRCQYDLLTGSPYSQAEPDKPKPTPIPLVDLKAQQQRIKLEIRRAMDRVILNTRYINGKEIGEFEESFAAFCGVPHAIGVASGTSALELALRALGVGPGDDVITQANSFVATAEAICAVGATPVFVDVEDAWSGLDPQAFEAAITPNTKVVIPVHLYGRLCDMERIRAIADRHGLAVVEDAAQAHGAERDGRRAGQWGDLGCFSFFPGKNLGAYGDAGGVVTSIEELASKVRKFRDHGRSEKYVSDVIGRNERMDTLQAAVLNVKLRHLGNWNEARRTVASMYRERLSGLPLVLPPPSGDDHVYHLFVVRTAQRDALKKHLATTAISSGIHYPVPLHLQPSLSHLGYGKGSFPITEKQSQEILSLPIYPEMTEEQVDRVAAAIKEFFGQP